MSRIWDWRVWHGIHHLVHASHRLTFLPRSERDAAESRWVGSLHTKCLGHARGPDYHTDPVPQIQAFQEVPGTTPSLGTFPQRRLSIWSNSCSWCRAPCSPRDLCCPPWSCFCFDQTCISHFLFLLGLCFASSSLYHACLPWLIILYNLDFLSQFLLHLPKYLPALLSDANQPTTWLARQVGVWESNDQTWRHSVKETEPTLVTHPRPAVPSARGHDGGICCMFPIFCGLNFRYVGFFFFLIKVALYKIYFLRIFWLLNVT